MGCGSSDPVGEQGSSSSPGAEDPSTSGSPDDGSTSTSDAGSTSRGASSGSESSTGTGSESGEEDADSTGETGGGVQPCSLWDPVCEDGTKCIAYGNFGEWNLTGCRSAYDPAVTRGVGEPCSVDLGVFAGFDNCDADALCFDIDASWDGTCVGRCGGTPEAPECPDGTVCAIEGGGAFSYCLDPCDPLDGGCSDGRNCVATESGSFVCVSAGPVEAGAPCKEFIDCEAGTSCTPTPLGASVCTPSCDPLQPECPDGMSCSPWGDAGLCTND